MNRLPVFLFSAAVLLVAAPALAQTAPASNPADDFTRELNGGPPRATTPVIVPAASPAATPARTTTPTAQPPATVQPRPTPPAAQPRVEPRSQPAATPPAATPPVAIPTPTTPPTSTEAVAEVAPPPSTVTVLDAAALSALPFRINLPAGFQITTGRPAPDFKVYAIERAGEPFVMIYTGPSAIFPIYEGEQVEAAGRTSIVVTENGGRHALEHLFLRSTAPAQVHVWVASVEPADQALAEAIAQSVDPR